MKPQNPNSVSMSGRWAFDSVDWGARSLDPGMGEAVARRTVFRESDGEDWGQVAKRVAQGSCSLLPVDWAEQVALRGAIAQGALLTSGRHLQHGDEGQATRPGELMTNCSTSATSFLKFMLLLNGSGVGRSYDDALMLVDWAQSPRLSLWLRPLHPDHSKLSQISSSPILKTGQPLPVGTDYFKVPDSREGWAQALELWEAMTFERQADRHLVLDFSDIRPEGAPIGGMQGRPCSGPVSLMRGFANAWEYVAAPAKAGKLPEPWKQNLVLDHYFSAEVQVGGVRRSARMAVKDWKDPGIFEFIRIKEAGGLWTANNSIMVDDEFWEEAKREVSRAHAIFEEATRCAYVNGEPGWINGDKLEDTATGRMREKPAVAPSGSKSFQPAPGKKLLEALATVGRYIRFPTIVNPCSEIPISTLGGYCVISDVAPALACPVPLDDIEPGSMDTETAALWDKRAMDTARLAARFLIRANTMDFIYGDEVKRTNRIGVGITGIHEWAWLRFGLGFRDLLDVNKSGKFWAALAAMSKAAKEEANAYADELGMARPSTVMTVKPSGSVSKLFGLTEGIHLPARRQYLRWVQFKGSKDGAGRWTEQTNPQVLEYEEKGYPTRALTTFQEAAIVGFPTMPLICRLGMGDELTIAPEATPEEQYEWLRLVEKYWLGEEQAGQASYTLKLYTNQHSLDDFRQIVLENQPTIKCCSILPSKPEADMGYEYLPETPLPLDEFEAIQARIRSAGSCTARETIDMEHLRCEAGVCPL